MLAERIKRRFSAENYKMKDGALQDDSPTEGTEGRHKVCPYMQDDSRNLPAVSCNLQPETRNLKPVTILEIDTHRPDRIIFMGKEVKVTTIGFSLLYLLAQHNGKVMSYEDIVKKLWGPETEAIYSRIIQHIYKFRKNILDTIGNNQTNREKIRDILKVVPGRGVMLNVNDKELKLN
jgi:helicase